MVVNGRPLKRMKRRITADLNDFLMFPVTGDGFPDDLDGPFRSNVNSFLSKHGELQPPYSLFPHLQTWQILFRIGNMIDGQDSPPAVVALDVVEEDVTRSRSVYCDQCRVVGWSGHPVCGKRFHFIIRADSSSIDGSQKPCRSCGDSLYLPDSRCQSCNYLMTEEDIEEWVYLRLEDTTHLLHGVVHTNGYGHLLRINGREGGSKFLSGCQIMDFWDRLCKSLRVRKVSVMDVSKKYGLEYRLFHAVTNGKPWYGNWGYEFGAGSFGLTLDAYQKAVDNLSKIPLSHFLSQSRRTRSRFHDVIVFYQSLSECELATTRDLFCFLVRLIHDAHKQCSAVQAACEKPALCTSKVLCAWTRNDIERVEGAIIRVLQAVDESHWVNWRTLRGAICKVGTPELLDYCLKEVRGKLAFDGMVVHARCNPDTEAIEYRLEHQSTILNDLASDSCLSSNCPTEEHLVRDLKFLYDALLHPQTMMTFRPQPTWEIAKSSASKLLDCKQFVKDYNFNEVGTNPFAISFSCLVELEDHPKDYTAPPPENITLPLIATVADLKIEATKAFQEVYVMFKRFQAKDLLDYRYVDDSTRVTFLVGSSGTIRVRGKCLGKHGLHPFRMERGTESWIVDCICGARDDDGERMLACDTCGVWQHTRCAGIHDLDPVPDKFVCDKCKSSYRKGVAGRLKPSRHCKDETVATAGARLGNNSAMPPFDVR